MPRSPRSLSLPLLGWVLFATLFACSWSKPARAERELIVPFDEGGHLVLDQLSGLRLSPTDGMTYSGPAGMAFRSNKVDALDTSGTSREERTSTLWLSPSFDYFVTEHFSVGGMIDLQHSWGSVTGGGQRLELPGTTSMTFLPRVGLYVPFSDRIGIWPRASFGYTSVESVSFAGSGGAAITDTFHAMMLDLDVSVVYRFGETFFMRAGPEVGATLGGQHTQESGGTSTGSAGMVWQVSGVVGFGMNIEL